jgi:hypothetical protein
MVFRRDAKIQTNRFDVPDVQKAIGFRRESRRYASVMFTAADIGRDNLANEILAGAVSRLCHRSIRR